MALLESSLSALRLIKIQIVGVFVLGIKQYMFLDYA